LDNAIVSTLAYFDVFHMPLTCEEVHQWLWKEQASEASVRDRLRRLHERGIIGMTHQFFYLPGRGDIVSRRQLATVPIDTKMTIATKAARRIRWIPFFRALFVCNTVASSSATEDSDIDVFIVVRQGRLWIS